MNESMKERQSLAPSILLREKYEVREEVARAKIAHSLSCRLFKTLYINLTNLSLYCQSSTLSADRVDSER